LPIFTKADERILFIHIPKAAGTTIEKLFVERGYAMDYRRGGVYGPLNEFDRQNGCSPQHLHAALLEKHLGGERFDRIFCIVRNPIDRFISEYRFRRQAGHKLAGGDINAFWESARRAYDRNPMYLDNHLRPQVDFLWRESEVFRLEDGMNSILRTLGLASAPEPTSRCVHAMKSDEQIHAVPAERTLAELTDFYRRDFEVLGYARGL